MATINVKDAGGATVAIEKPLTPGRAPDTASRPVALSDEDVALLQTVADRLNTMLGHTDGLEGGLSALSALALTTIAFDLPGSGLNPIPFGGYANDTEPTPVSADLDIVRPWYKRNGRAVNEAGHPSLVYTLTPTLDTNAYAAGDVLFATVALTSIPQISAGRVMLHSVAVIDTDDQGIGMDLIFLDANQSLGTFNVAPDIDDTEVLASLGFVSILAADYIDLGANRVATRTGIGLMLESTATSLWVAGITRGAPTHTASGMRIKFGFQRL